MLVELALAQVHVAIHSVLIILVVRFLPFVVAFSADLRSRWSERLVAICCYAAIALLAAHLASFDYSLLILAVAYFGVVTVLLYPIATRMRSRIFRFVLFALLFMVLPSLSRSDGRVLWLVLGWDLMLSAYSYACEKRSGKDFWQYLFFIFVNPTLTYSHRGVMVSTVGFDGRGLVRVLAGCAALFVSEMLTTVPRILASVAEPVRMAGALVDVVALFRFYAAHVGLAALQIGLARQLGLKVPERYNRPFAARSAKEFWMRWNTYVGTWVRVYIFNPIALAIGRAAFETSYKRLLYACAVVGAFAGVGILHDLYDSLQRREIHLWGSAWFALNGVIVVAWESVARALRARAFPGTTAFAQFGRKAIVIATAVALFAVFP